MRAPTRGLPNGTPHNRRKSVRSPPHAALSCARSGSATPSLGRLACDDDRTLSSWCRRDSRGTALRCGGARRGCAATSMRVGVLRSSWGGASARRRMLRCPALGVAPPRRRLDALPATTIERFLRGADGMRSALSRGGARRGCAATSMRVGVLRSSWGGARQRRDFDGSRRRSSWGGRRC